MKQSRLGSLIETGTNIVIGWTLNFFANIFFFPMFGWDISVEQNLVLGTIYTGISVARSYTIRRFFNSHIHRFSSSLANLMSTEK